MVKSGLPNVGELAHLNEILNQESKTIEKLFRLGRLNELFIIKLNC